jgi:predicted dehydrogenase
VVAAPTALHGALVNQLLTADKPVYCEKPLTSDAAAARGIAARGSDRVFVMHKWRYHPGIEAMAALARAGAYGPVREIHTRRLQWTPDEEADAIWTLAPHDLSIVYAILGRLPRAIAATGEGGDEGRARSLVGLLRDEGGPGVVIHVAANWPHTERSVCVVFKGAAVVMDDPLADHIKIFRNGTGKPGTEERQAVSTEYPLLRELRAFTDHIGGGPPPKTTAAEGVLVVEAIERLRRLAGIN